MECKKKDLTKINAQTPLKPHSWNGGETRVVTTNDLDVVTRKSTRHTHGQEQIAIPLELAELVGKVSGLYGTPN